MPAATTLVARKMALSRLFLIGGAVIGTSADRGVVDAEQRAYGYENLLICDGSVVPANVGVNPALTILALAERAVARVPAAGEG